MANKSGERYIHTTEDNYELVVPRRLAQVPRKLFEKTPEGLALAVAMRDAAIKDLPPVPPKPRRKVMPGVYRGMNRGKNPYWFVYRMKDGKKTMVSFYERKYGPLARKMAEATKKALDAGQEPPVFNF